MKCFTSLVASALLVAAAIGTTAQAQVNNYNNQPTTLFNTANLTGGLLVNTNATTWMTNKLNNLPPGYSSTTLNVQANISAIAACDSNLVVTVNKSVDGLTWDSFQSVTIPANGTTPVTFVTNWTCPYPIVQFIFSGGGTAAKAFTNTTVKAQFR